MYFQFPLPDRLPLNPFLPRSFQQAHQAGNTVEMKEMGAPVPNNQNFTMEMEEGNNSDSQAASGHFPYVGTSGSAGGSVSGGSYVHTHHMTSHGYIPTTVVRRRTSATVQPRRRRLLSNFRQKAKNIKVKIPRVQDVNTIDKYSRLLFPLLFVLFNASYWAIYLLT